MDSENLIRHKLLARGQNRIYISKIFNLKIKIESRQDLPPMAFEILLDRLLSSEALRESIDALLAKAAECGSGGWVPECR